MTIRRPVVGRAAVCINVSDRPDLELCALPPTEWTHHGLGVGSATKTLNRVLNLTAVSSYTYRKGLGYFLRRQTDYSDEFRTSRFARGRDVDWKPFVALLVGFDDNLVSDKYELDRKRSAKKNELAQAEASGDGSAAEVDELRGVLEIRENEVQRLRTKVGAFDFVEIESQMTRRTVREVENRIGELNEDRFALEREAQEIDRALETEFGFDLKTITAAFVEAQIALPRQLARDYEELVAFNQRMSTGRRERLGVRRSEIRRSIASLTKQLEALNEQRIESLEIVTQRKTLEKFRALQTEVLREEEDLAVLRQRLRQLGEAGRIAADLRNIEKERLRMRDRIEEMVDKRSERYRAIRTLFNEFARAILSVPAVLATRVNKEGNLEFHTKILETRDLRRQTSEDEGTSYKKALCVCVDLALLVAYARDSFYRFVYHDGVFEGFDNRRKVALLRAVRRACEDHGIQYVLTVIDADLPRDEEDNKVLFTEDEIVRELHDRGVQGRLFRMERF